MLQYRDYTLLVTFFSYLVIVFFFLFYYYFEDFYYYCLTTGTTAAGFGGNSNGVTTLAFIRQGVVLLVETLEKPLMAPTCTVRRFFRCRVRQAYVRISSGRLRQAIVRFTSAGVSEHLSYTR